MTRFRLAAPVAALAALPLLAGACTLYPISGDGPVPRSFVAHMLQDPAPEETRARADALLGDAEAERQPDDRFTVVGRDSGFTWPFLAGGWSQDGYVAPKALDSATDREFISQERIGGLLAPLVYYHRIATWDDVETGSRVSSKREGGLPLLYSRNTLVEPVVFVGGRPDRRFLDKRYPLEQVPYGYQKGVDLLAGLIGWGERNRGQYFKFLFVEIRVGTAETERPPEETPSGTD
jgi:hypothetical protein